MNTFSLVINHTPWIPERVKCLDEMLKALNPTGDSGPTFINDADYRGTEWQQTKVKWALDQWRWAAQHDATHHVFMTDDLFIHPRFWDALQGMTANVPDCPIGLLSNHPNAIEWYTAGHRWYMTRSWLVGPAYVLPHEFLLRFLPWFEAKPDGSHEIRGTKAWANDDSSINEFVSFENGKTFHPLPTIIEHRNDIGSTVGHGDRHSRERLSWRFARWVEDRGRGEFDWHSASIATDANQLATPEYWKITGKEIFC